MNFLAIFVRIDDYHIFAIYTCAYACAYTCPYACAYACAAIAADVFKGQGAYIWQIFIEW